MPAPMWVRLLGRDWWVACQGMAPYGQIGKFCKPLVEKFGLDQVRRHWQVYLGLTIPRYCSPAKFAQTFGSYARQDPPRPVYLTPDELDVRAGIPLPPRPAAGWTALGKKGGPGA